MSNNYKLIFTGPTGSGKTTAISTLSDIPVVKTEEKSTRTGNLHTDKREVTVALDYGIIKMKNGDKIHLYGTPGQERFDFMWNILTKGGLGLILLIDNAREDPLEDMRYFIEIFRSFINETKLVVGITCMDMCCEPRISQYHEKLHAMNLSPPVFEVDARNKKDLSLLLQALLYSLDPGLNTQ